MRIERASIHSNYTSPLISQSHFLPCYFPTNKLLDKYIKLKHPSLSIFIHFHRPLPSSMNHQPQIPNSRSVFSNHSLLIIQHIAQLPTHAIRQR